MTMEQITAEDLQSAYDELLAALRETYEDNPVLWHGAFGEDGPPYDQWLELIETYCAGLPESAEAIAEAIGRDVVGPLRSNAGEATYGESGGQTSQALSDPVQNIHETVSDWTDEAGQEFKSVYLMGQSGLQNKLQFQYEFAVALQAIMQTQQSVLLFARAGVIDIFRDTADALRKANEHRRKRRSTIGDMLTDTLIQTGVSALTGNWAVAAATAVKGVAQAAVTDMTWPDTDDPAEICTAMVENFDPLRGDLEERVNGVQDAIVELQNALAGSARETFLPPQTSAPTPTPTLAQLPGVLRRDSLKT